MSVNPIAALHFAPGKGFAPNVERKTVSSENLLRIVDQRKL